MSARSMALPMMYNRFTHIKSCFVLLISCFLAIAYSATVSSSQRPRRPVDRFSRYGRRCFQVKPCILFANQHGQYGCAQCDAAVVRAPVVEFVTREDMITFVESGLLRRFVMIPEFLFYDPVVLSALESVREIAGLVVYAGDSRNVDSAPAIQKLPSPPVEDLSVDFAEPNMRHNYYPNIKLQEESLAPDYRNPESIIENIRKKASNESLINVRNGYGTGLKFRFFRYNVFHVSNDTAAEIRELFNRFSDTEISGAQQQSDSDRSPTTPQYQLESIGRMFACPSASASPSPSPTTGSPSPSPSVSVEVEPDDSESGDDSSDNEDEDTDESYSSSRTVPFYERARTYAGYYFDALIRRRTFLKKTISRKYAKMSRQEAADPTPSELPSTDSEKCLSERTCLPIGGQSVWSSLGRLAPRFNDLGEPLDSYSNHSVIAVTAPMDSMAFFPDLAVGASAEISSLAVLMAVAEAVGNYWRSEMGGKSAFEYQPVYMAWNAQSWGWAGSSRFLKDLDRFRCTEVSQGPGCLNPFMASLKFFDLRNLSRLNVINIGQMISPNAPENFELPPNVLNHFYFDSIYKSQEYLRRCEQDNEGSLYSDFEDIHDDQPSLSGNIRISDDSGRISNSDDRDDRNDTLYPLDASQSFRKYYRHNRDDPNDCNFKTVSINNYQVNFTNRYYHSIYDVSNLTNYSTSTSNTARQQSGASTSSSHYRKPMYVMGKLIAQVVAKKAFGDSPALLDLDINPATVDKVITCMAGNWTECQLKDEYMGSSQLPNHEVAVGNYAGSFFPSTLVGDKSPSWFIKLALLQNMFAYFNRYDAPVETEAEASNEPESSSNSEETTEPAAVPIECQTVEQCADFNKTVNSNVGNQTERQTVFCARKECVLSDTYLHDAFGTAIEPNNSIRSNFTQVDDHGFGNSSDPEGGAWTESGWGEDLGLCGYVEDSQLYGGLILGAGIAVTVGTFVAFLWIDRYLFSEITVPATEETPLTSQPVPP